MFSIDLKDLLIHYRLQCQGKNKYYIKTAQISLDFVKPIWSLIKLVLADLLKSSADYIALGLFISTVSNWDSVVECLVS